MEETQPTAELRLKQLNEERKTLKVQVKGERDLRLERAAKMRVLRDERIEKIQTRLNTIQSAIFQYKKLGKVGKSEFDVLGMISKAFNAEEDIVADSAN